MMQGKETFKQFMDGSADVKQHKHGGVRKNHSMQALISKSSENRAKPSLSRAAESSATMNESQQDMVENKEEKSEP